MWNQFLCIMYLLAVMLQIGRYLNCMDGLLCDGLSVEILCVFIWWMIAKLLLLTNFLIWSEMKLCIEMKIIEVNNFNFSNCAETNLAPDLSPALHKWAILRKPAKNKCWNGTSEPWKGSVGNSSRWPDIEAGVRCLVTGGPTTAALAHQLVQSSTWCLILS